MTITLISTLYNSNPYINTYIESINNQTNMDFSYILIDACSVDNIIDLVFNKIAVTNKRFYRLNERMSIHESLLYGISKVESDYYFFLDTDDAIRYQTIELLKSLIESVDADLILFPDSRSALKNIPTEKVEIMEENKDNLIKEFLLYTKRGAYTSKLIKKRYYNTDSTRIYKFHYSPDIFLTFLIILNSYKIYSVNQQINVMNLWNHNSTNRNYYKSRIIDYINVYRTLNGLIYSRSINFNEYSNLNLERLSKEIIYDFALMTLKLNFFNYRQVYKTSIALIDNDLKQHMLKRNGLFASLFKLVLERSDVFSFIIMTIIGCLYKIHIVKNRILDKIYFTNEKVKYTGLVFDFKANKNL
jgi:glycosyltransferase involved in cell wall biosynthesis